MLVGEHGHCAQHLPRTTAVPSHGLAKRTVPEIWAQAAVNRDCIEGIGGVRAGLIRWSLANTAVWDLHLSPDGGKHHVRWGGGGQETGARAQASSACGLTQGQRWTQSTRACLLPDHVLDQAWAKRGRGRLVRYADDGVVLCGSREEAEAALELVRDVLCELGLELHPEKTRIVDLSEGREGFDFLGCHFHARVSGSMLERGIRRYYLHRWPSARSMKRVRQRVKELTGRNRNGVRDVRVLIKDLNPVLRGWGNYFRTGNAALKFNQLDRYVVSRLHRFLVKRHGRNLRHGRADQWTREWFWQLGLHRFRGTVRYPTAA